MKKITLFFILFSNSLFSQADTTVDYRDTVSLNDTISFFDKLLKDTLKYNLSNTITSSYASNTKQLGFSYSGANNFTYGKFGFYNTSSVSDSWVNVKVAEEISQKSNITYSKLFLLYMFNHSLTRGMVADNSFGIGYVHWWKYVSLSYGVLHEKTTYTTLPNVFVFRHSLRFKLATKFLSMEYYYQPNIIQSKDVIITGITKLSLWSGKAFSVTLNDNINFRSMSATKMIHSCTLGVSYVLVKK